MNINKADILKFKALIKALDSEKVKFVVDYNVLHKPGSPIYNPWDALLPLLVLVVGSLFIMLLEGAYIGLFALVIGFLLYIYGVKKLLTKYLRKKAQKYMVKNPLCWNKIWDFGGVALMSTSSKAGVSSPDGDWQDFIVLNFSELMVDDGEPVKEENDEEENS